MIARAGTRPHPVPTPRETAASFVAFPARVAHARRLRHAQLPLYAVRSALAG
jgi:hypothetical protein